MRFRVAMSGVALLTLVGAAVVAVSPAHAVPLCEGKVPTIDLNAHPGTPATSGSDVILGTSGIDVISGLGGNDTICGLDAGDTINGGSGNDAILPGLGNDSVKGGDGVDTVSYSDAPSTVNVNLGVSLPQATFGSGNEMLVDAFENLTGSPSADFLYDANGNNTIKGGAGNDLIVTHTGMDRLKGGADTDILNFDAPQGITVDLAVTTEQATGSGKKIVLGFEKVGGTPFADTISGTDGNNTLIGAAGKDLLVGRGGDDNLFGQDGADRLMGGLGADYCDGGESDGDIDAASGCENVTNFP